MLPRLTAPALAACAALGLASSACAPSTGTPPPDDGGVDDLDAGVAADAGLPPPGTDAGTLDAGFEPPRDAGFLDDAGAVDDGGAGDAGVVDAGPPPPPARPFFAFSSDRTGDYDVYLARADATVEPIAPDPGLDLYPAFSPDATKIAFTSTRGGRQSVWIHDLAAGTTSDATPTLASASTPVFDPSGGRLVVEGRETVDDDPDLWSVPLDGAPPFRLTDDPANDSGPSFTADGQRIFFVSNRGGAYEVWSMDAAGDDEVALTSGSGILGGPAVAPDGSGVAYARMGAGAAEIVLRSTTSADERVVTGVGDSEPAFSPDGARMLVTSVRDGDPDVWLVDVETAAATKVVDAPGIDGAAAFAPEVP